MKIRTVAEIVLNVEDLVGSVSFYKQALGLTVHSEEAHELPGPNATGKPTIVFLTLFDAETPLAQDRHPPMLVLIDSVRHAFAGKRLGRVQRGRTALNHFALEIDADDFNATRTHLESLGLSPSIVEFDRLNARGMFFKDPEGNTIELIAPLANR
ncbi:MAG: VOC family protein [Planctomycetota bacterium]